MKASDYIDTHGNIQVPLFRANILTELQQLKQAYESLLHSSEGELTFRALQNHTALMSDTPERDLVQQTLRHITGIPEFIASWISLAVDTPERFDFFVLTAAQEIKTGNEQADYYKALGMRYDQLLGLIRVLTHFLAHVKRFMALPLSHFFEDEIFLGLIRHPLEEQIYLEAQHVYRDRMAIPKR